MNEVTLSARGVTNACSGGRNASMMAELPEQPTHLQAEVHFRNLLDEEGFASPDEVRHWRDPDEVVFMWHEPRVAIVIELGPDGVDVREGYAAEDPPV